MHWRICVNWWKDRPGRATLAIGALLILTGPATAASPLSCREWFEDAQRALDEHGIHDAGSERIEWYPHLRFNRWLAAARPEGNGEAARFWLQRLADQARAGWHAELARLPGDALKPGNLQQRLAQLDTCIDTLLTVTNASRLPALEIPDAYAGWQRSLGVYPVTKWLAVPAIRDYREDMNERFDRETDLDRHHYLPPAFTGTPPEPDALAHNPLNMPWPTRGAAEALLAHYAPVLSLPEDSPANRPATLGLDHGSPEAVPLAATAYTWVSWQFFQEQPLIQLNYAFWFSRRPHRGPVDPYAGKLDGLIWRVTLRSDGRVLAYDSIHPCGCYHKVYAVDPLLKPVAPDQAGQPVFYPYPAPDALRQRVQVVLEADTHYVVAVRPFNAQRPGERHGYQLADADRLRRLPVGEGHGSLYRPDGLIAGTQRAERFFLWPLGVPSAGAMRQPGHHAVAFIGKRHFDDARMLETLLQPSRPGF